MKTGRLWIHSRWAQAKFIVTHPHIHKLSVSSPLCDVSPHDVTALCAQKIAVYGCGDQQSLQSWALTQEEPVTAERESSSSSSARWAFRLIRAANGGSRDCRAASPSRERHAGLFIGPLRMGQLQLHLTSLLRRSRLGGAFISMLGCTLVFCLLALIQQE